MDYTNRRTDIKRRMHHTRQQRAEIHRYTDTDAGAQTHIALGRSDPSWTYPSEVGDASEEQQQQEEEGEEQEEEAHNNNNNNTSCCQK